MHHLWARVIAYVLGWGIAAPAFGYQVFYMHVSLARLAQDMMHGRWEKESRTHR